MIQKNIKTKKINRKMDLKMDRFNNLNNFKDKMNLLIQIFLWMMNNNIRLNTLNRLIKRFK
jgi:hypothetical protein